MIKVWPWPQRGTLPIVRNDFQTSIAVTTAKINNVSQFNPILNKVYSMPNRNWIIALIKPLMPVVAKDMPTRVQKPGFQRIGGVATRAYLAGQAAQQGSQQ